jgi:hypothetical protein
MVYYFAKMVVGPETVFKRVPVETENIVLSKIQGIGSLY